MKKLLFLFALSLCSLVVRAYDFSAVAPTGQTLYYSIMFDGYVEVVCPNQNNWDSYQEPEGYLIIPSTVEYNNITYTIIFIGSNAFKSCTLLTNVDLPNTIQTISDGAFENCSNLSYITLPNSISLIGSGAFRNCSNLYYLSLPYNCWIESCSFENCTGLSDLIIPSDVYYIGERAFIGCSNITSIVVDENNPNYDSRNDCNAIIETATNKLILGCKTTEIPNTVTTIGSYSFSYCYSWDEWHWYNLSIPNSVESIEYDAFSHCSRLLSVTIPNSVTNIDFNNPFSDCEYLSRIIVSEGNPRYDSRNNCNAIIETATNRLIVGCPFSDIPSTVTKIGNFAFLGCSNLTNVTIPNTVTTIGSGAFGRCRNLRSITIPNSVTEIYDYCFAVCSSLTNVTLPDSLNRIGHFLFYQCSSLTSIKIPKSVTAIGSEAFQDCVSLTDIIIPNRVSSIGQYTFSGCSSLNSIVIPNSVNSIGNNAFDDCSNLKTVYNLSNLSIAKNNYGLTAMRVVAPVNYGMGDNTIYKIPATYSYVNTEDNNTYHIPRSTIPTNFIYKDGSAWKAKKIVLTDGQDAFEAPETFTAETATYTREFTNSNRSTLYLPFTAAIPENFEVYDFTSFANNTISFTKREDSIYAYTPYLVGYDLSKDGNTTTCTITKTNAVFPKSESANYHPVTRNGMTFQGVLERTEMTSTNNYGYSNGFFVQSGGHAHVNPFRSYFTYTAPAGAPQSLPPTLNVEVGYGDPLDIDAVETPEQEYDGRYGKDVYDMLGRLVRKNADNLEGLPKGVYLWKGKKHVVS